MLHPKLAELLRRRLALIADHGFRDRDTKAHLAALAEISQQIMDYHEKHQDIMPAKLEHFIINCSFDKALKFLESDGSWQGH